MSRRKGRHARRQERRRQALLRRTEEVGGVPEIFTFSTLYKAGKACCRGVRWKNSTQRFELHLFSGTAKRRREVLDGRWKPGKYHRFTLTERGKRREIDAPRIQDRQVEKVLTQRGILPLYLPGMIYNNGASLRGKGFHFSMGLVKRDLGRHFRKYGREGTILLLDFERFFPSASHEVILDRHRDLILKDDLRGLLDKIVERTLGDRGMPLGVEPSQAEMIGFPSGLDTYLKCQLGIHGAGHYMDDYYLLLPPGTDADEVFQNLQRQADRLGLRFHPGKRQARKLVGPFRYCKTQFSLTETGKVITHGSRESRKRDRRKLRALAKKFHHGEIERQDVDASMNGMLQYFRHYQDHDIVLELRQLFCREFGFAYQI